MEHDSILLPANNLPFEFMFNDYFSRDVHLRYFDYKPYILNFLFGIFCLIKPYESEHRITNHKFYVPDEKDRSRWLLIYNNSNFFHLDFVNFYLDDSIAGAQLSQREYEILTNDSIFDSGKISKISIHEYAISPLLSTSNTLKLTMKRLQRQRWVFDGESDRSIGYKYMEVNDYLYATTKNFWNLPDKDNYRPLLNAVENFLKLSNRTIDTSASFGYMHGILYASKKSEVKITIRHHQQNGSNSFYISTTGWRGDFTISFLGDTPNSNHIQAIDHFDLSCEEYQMLKVFHHNYGIQLSDNCCRSSFHDNGRDYLENLFEHLKMVTDEGMNRDDFLNYFGYVFEEVRPTNIRYDETSIDYLRFFIIGTFSSSVERGYEAKVHFFENIFLFKPKISEYPFIILTLNTDCQRVSLSDLEDGSSNTSNLVFCVSISESASRNDMLLSKKFLRRTFDIKLIPQYHLTNNAKLFPKWFVLNRFHILEDLLNSRQNLTNITDIIENTFEILHDVDYKYSFHPFMHGLFYRSVLSKAVRIRRLWFVKRLSKWTFALNVFDLKNGWRNWYFYFLPSFEETVQFVNMIEQREWEGTNRQHIFFVYDARNQKLQTLVSKETYLRNTIEPLVQTVCKLYSYYGADFCGLNGGNPYDDDYKYRLESLRKYFSIPNSLIRHAEFIDQLAPVVKKKHTVEGKLLLNSTNQWSVKRSKIVRPYKKIHDHYLLGKNLMRLNINVTGVGMNQRDSRNIADTAAKKMWGLTRYRVLGPIQLPKLVDVVRSHSLHLSKTGKHALDAILNFLTSNLMNNDPTNVLQPLNEVLELLVWELTLEKFAMKVFNDENAASGIKRESKKYYGATKSTWSSSLCLEGISIHTCTRGQKSFGNIIHLPKKDRVQRSADTNRIRIYCSKSITLPSSTVTVEEEPHSLRSQSFHCENISAIISSTKSEYIITRNNCTIQVIDAMPIISLRHISSFRPTSIAIVHVYSTIEGSDADDIFDFVFSLQCGSIFGGPGDDTVKLNRYISTEYELLIKSYSINYRKSNGTQETHCVSLDSIERIMGQPNSTETVFVDCAFTMISLNGGQPNHPDVIYVPQHLNCPDVISFVVHGYTVIRNVAQRGRFLYKVSSLVNSSAKLYLDGANRHIVHTIIMEYASLNDIISISLEENILSILSKSNGILLLSISCTTFDCVNLILKHGEQLFLAEKSLQLKQNDVKHSLAEIMDKYADIGLFQNMSLNIESYRFDMSFQIMKHKIQHVYESPLPFRFMRLQLDSSNSSIECSSEQIYVLVLSKTESPYEARVVTFVSRQSGNASDESCRLIIDLTRIQEHCNRMGSRSIVSISQVENSVMFLVTVSVIINGVHETLCQLFFDGFDDVNNLNNILILHQWKYQPTLYDSNIGDVQSHETADNSTTLNNNTLLILKKVPRVFRHLVDNIAVFEIGNVDFDEELVFPTILLTNYDVIRAKNHLVLTSVLSNIDNDVRKISQSLFTFVLKDFFTNPKMKTLILKFGNGLIVNTKDILAMGHVHPINKFRDSLAHIEHYLAEKEAKATAYISYNKRRDIFEEKIKAEARMKESDIKV